MHVILEKIIHKNKNDIKHSNKIKILQCEEAQGDSLMTRLKQIRSNFYKEPESKDTVSASNCSSHRGGKIIRMQKVS